MTLNYGNNYRAFLNNGGKPTQAEAAFRRSIDINPTFIAARRNLAGLLAGRDSTRSEALRLYEDLTATEAVAADIRSEFALV